MSITKDERVTHDLIAAEVAKRELHFPNAQHPDWLTISNRPNPGLALPLGSESIFPDIAIIDNESVVQRLGEVEIEKTVNEEEMEKWIIYSDYCGGDLYLYVPEVRATVALNLLNSNRIPYTRLIQYSFFYGEVRFKRV